MIVINKEQREMLDSGKAVEVTDSESIKPYVVLRKDVFERFQHLVYDDSEMTEYELRHQLARFSEGNGWDDPSMDIYDRYDEELRKRRP